MSMTSLSNTNAVLAVLWRRVLCMFGFRRSFDRVDSLPRLGWVAMTEIIACQVVVLDGSVVSIDVNVSVPQR